MLIYLVLNRVNGKVYIGQCAGSLMRRWGGHRREALQYGSKLYFHSAIRKYGVGAFSIHLLSSYATSKQDLDAQEQHFIAKYRATEKEYGYNLAIGGGGTQGATPWNKGKVYSEEERKNFKKSEAAKQKIRAARKQQPAPMLGKSHSDATKQKQSVSAKAWRSGRILNRKPMTEETKQKISQATTGRKPSIPKGSKMPDTTRVKIQQAKQNISPETREKLRLAALIREAKKRKIISQNSVQNRGKSGIL